MIGIYIQNPESKTEGSLQSTIPNFLKKSNQSIKQTNSFLPFFLAQGVRKGDRVSIYLPMIPELVYTMLACARIGAVHSVVVGNTKTFLE